MSGPLSGIQRREHEFLVGRDNELQRFSLFLNGDSLEGKNVWNLFGTGGIGKSTLLDAFRRMSLEHGSAFLYLDSRDFHHSARGIGAKLLQQCGIHPPVEQDGESEWLAACLKALLKMSERQRVTIALDTYEEMEDLDPLLRGQLIQWLPVGILVVIAGRHPLNGPWLYSPAWRERVERFPLGHLNRDDALDYLDKCRVPGDEREPIWLKSKGHPLALSLAVSTHTAQNEWSTLGDDDWFDHLVELWLREVPDPEIRDLVEIASVLRQFDQESLSYVSGKPVFSRDIDRLCRLSFVRRSARGWSLHDLMRDATTKLLKERTPSRYRLLLARCAAFYRTRILQSPRDGSAAWDMHELFSYIGNATIRWIVSPTTKGHYYWETATADHMNEAKQYLERRFAEAQSVISAGTDLKNEHELDIHMDVLRIKELELNEYLNVDSNIVKLLRSETGTIAGLSVIFPMNAGTIPLLQKDPLARHYLKSLSIAEYKELLAPPNKQAGWFIRIIDVEDGENPVLAMEALSLLFSLMVSDSILVASPPPHPVQIQAHLNLGFVEAPNVQHSYYDDRTPTSTFVLDTRGNKLCKLLDDLLRNTGIKQAEGRTSPPSKAADADPPSVPEPDRMAALTEREREIAKLVLNGLSNADIAGKLYITEVTVKKHLHSVYEKLQVRNRTDLLRLFLTR